MTDPLLLLFTALPAAGFVLWVVATWGDTR